MFRSPPLIFSSTSLPSGPALVGSQFSLLGPDAIVPMALGSNPGPPKCGSSSPNSPSTSNGSPGAIFKGERCVGCSSESAIRVHYGAPSCHGCKAFFRRSVFEGRSYACSAENNCNITNESRNRCRACRLRNCLEGGMNPKHVREERSKIERTPPDISDQEALEKQQSATPPREESQLTHFVCSLERQTELLTDDDVITNDENCEWSRDVSLTFGLQNPRMVIRRSPINWHCERVMNSADLYGSWYRAFVLHADWAMGIPDFRAIPLVDQTSLFKQNFMAFGWMGHAFNCYTLKQHEIGIPLGNGAFIPYGAEEQKQMEPKWAATYGVVGQKLIDLIVKPMIEMQMTNEEYCLLKTIALFQQDCTLSPTAQGLCGRFTDRLLEALAVHIDRQFPNLTPHQRTMRAVKLTLLLPSFNHIGQTESTMIQSLTAADLNELSGVPMEIMNTHRNGGTHF